MAEQTPQQLDAELIDAGSNVGSKRPTGTRLPPEAEAQIEERRVLNLITAAIAGCSWGKSMSSPMRRAYADYCHRYDVDPVTEMDNLGGSVYVNADWYRRKLGELRLRGIVKDYFIEHIQADPRIEKLRHDQSIPAELRKRAQEKWFDMLIKRVEHNAPEEAAAICVCTIDVGSGTPIKGCKWAGNGTSIKQPRHNGGAAPNPIAESNPTLFVETSSIRRACVQLFSHLSGQRIAELPAVDAMDQEITALAEKVASSMPQGEPAESIVPEPGPQLLTSGYNEIEAFETAQRQQRQSKGEALTAEVVKRTPEQRAHFQRVAAQFAETPDPYEDPHTVKLPEFPPADPENPTPFDPDPAHDIKEQAERWTAETDPHNASYEIPKTGKGYDFPGHYRAPSIDNPHDPYKDLINEGARPEEPFPREPGPKWTPGDDAAELVERVKSDEQSIFATDKPLKPLRVCMGCPNRVSGPWTDEHDPECAFYQAVKPDA